MIPISSNVVKFAISKNKSTLDKYIEEIKNNLAILKNDPTLDKDQKKYVNSILSKSRNLIFAVPATLKRYKNDFDKIIHPDDIAHKDNKNFRESILGALEYESRRKDFYPEYFSLIGIKACVYCNSQFALTVNRTKKGNPIAKFQVDHHIPKNKYPGLSVSLYNLYPSCANCNLVKGTKTVSFKLYDKHKLSYKSQFTFNLQPGVKSKYLSTRKLSDIKFLFEEPIPKKGDTKFNDLFDIVGIYETQLDIVEELLLKAEIYTKSYKDSLKSAFPKLLPDNQALDRLIIGIYPDENSLHKRPLSKFIVDIAKQIKLIK